MNLIPIIVVGGALLFLSNSKKKKKKKKKKKNGGDDSGHKALPSSVSGKFSGHGALKPDMIELSVGEKVTISFEENPSTGFRWIPVAAPADGSATVEQPEEPILGSSNDPAGASNLVVGYTVSANKAGEGSIVFHYDYPWMVGKQEPGESSEIVIRVR